MVVNSGIRVPKCRPAADRLASFVVVTTARQDYCWDGEIAQFADVFEGLHPTGSYSTTLNSVPHRFDVAVRADYEAAFRAAGRLTNQDAIEDHPELVAAVQAHWHASGHNGCRFAMYLSEHRERFGWETWVMARRSSAAVTAEAIGELARERIDPVEVDVLSVVLPHIDTPDGLGDIVRALGERDDWKLSEGEDPLDGDVALLGLSIGIDLGHWSEILGFGRGDPLAHTRQAPFTELAIRAKPPRNARQNQRAFMADVPLDEDSATIAKWGNETKRSRAQRLGDEHDTRGKAKWTTVVHRSKGG
jgi:hypothetical protein